jgi:hypothetical protein
VPTQARGFIVELPGGGRLVDLGTSFVASVDAADRASVCVLKGAVRVEDAAGESRTLTAGGQLALDSTGRVIEASLAAADSEASPIGDAYAVAVAAADPLAYWRFDATDRPRLISVAAGAYPLELSPAAAASADTPGVLRFDDPTGESFATADALAGKLTGEAYTIECWVRPDAAQLGSLVSIDTGVYLGLTGDHDPQNWPARSIRFVHRQLGLSWGGANLAAPYVPGRWTHLTAVRDRNRVMLYVNGKLAASGREAARWPHAPASVLIGRLRSPDPTYDNARPFLGRLDELAIYNRPLSAREIESHYNFRQHPQGETP